MTMIPLSEARSYLTDVVNEVACAGKRVILTRKGKMLAVSVSLEDFEFLETMKNQKESGIGLKKILARRKHKAKIQDETRKA